MTTQDTMTGHTRWPATAAAARDQVRHLLATTGPPPPETVLNDILLVTSELVTNALRHGGGITAFDAVREADALHISVSDRSPTPPGTLPRRHPATPGGYGWPLIRQLSARVTVEPSADGKTITAVVRTR
ncbi:ATP-binding protein [Streptomyces sp. DH12]|uniref:ATP-binding protein n=1 Tax=Streptomyces sp. DH12 TaxID=2857010 RepID=UPI001E390FF4|nr:ATP-binding protein [Streptomyces sp. DH12]